MSSIRVLIVEDNAVARSFLTRVVRESFSDDIRFSEVSSPEAARRLLGIAANGVAQADHDAFRLILCDLEQPDGLSIEFLQQLHQYPAIKIATTLHSDDEHLFPALLAGANGYLLKEDRFEVLVEELQRIVRGQPPLSPAMARRFLGFFRQSLGRTPDTLQPDAKEHEVLSYLSKGYTTKEIARLMGIKWHTVNDHIHGAYRKLGAASALSRVTL